MPPLHRNRIFYEIFLRSFYDSNKDGIGDINGLILKLDYLEDLGVEGIWLMPIHPSPSYHKYDVADYYAIDPEYGTLSDFKRLLKEAHKRGIKIIIDLVVNHTSYRHPWFLKAQKNPDSPFHTYYNWKEYGMMHHQAGWHKLPGNEDERQNRLFYFGHFSSEMPDLNYDHPKVREEVINIGKYWLGEIGVDGFRLDAAQYIYPHQHKKNCAWWRQFRKEMETVNKDVFLIGEVWAQAEIAAPYLEKALHAVFNFDMGYKIMDVVSEGKNLRIAERHQQIRDLYRKHSRHFIDTTFITNHDQDRVMSGAKKNMDKAKMAASLLFTLPGSPFIYYGEEIGMTGKKPDENIREPFIWSTKKGAAGQTRWMKSKYNTLLTPLSLQIKNPDSLWNHYKTLIHLRKNNPLLSEGEIELVELKNKKLIAFYRALKGKALLIIHNPSAASIQLEMCSADKPRPCVYFRSNEKCELNGSILTIAKYSTVIFDQM